MKKVFLPLVDSAQCQKALRKTRLGRFFKLDRSFLCAGGDEGVDVCHVSTCIPTYLILEIPITHYHFPPNIVHILGCRLIGMRLILGGKWYTLENANLDPFKFSPFESSICSKFKF